MQSYVNQTNVERWRGQLSRNINLIRPSTRNKLEEASVTEDFEDRNSILKEGMDLLSQRNKVLILSDKYGWETAAAYGTDPVASDSEDEKKIKRACKEAKAIKDEKAKLKNLKQKQNFQSKKPFAVQNRVNQSSSLSSCTPTLTEGYSVGVVENRAISPRLVNPQYQEILDPDNSEVISQTHLFDDKPKSDCQGDETSSFVNLDFSFFCLENFYFALRYFPLTNIITHTYKKNLIHLKIQNNQSEYLKTVCHNLTLLKGNLRPKQSQAQTKEREKTTPETLHPKARNPGKTDIATPQAPSPTPIKHDATDANTAGQRKTKAQHPRCPMLDSPETPQAATTRQRNSAPPHIPPLWQPEPELLPTIEKQKVYRSSISDNLKQYSLIATASSIKF